MAVDKVEPTRHPAGTSVKYNPHLWTDDELRDIFVVRQAQLAELIDRMRSTPANVAPQATLFVGARGMGKTTLLRRLALAVREDPETSRDWLPLSFPEEQYTVSGLGELWRNVLDALIDALERGGVGRAEIAALDRRAQDLAAAAPEAQAALALALISAWSQQHQRRLLLLIDSTDLLLEGLKRGTRAPAKKKARSAGSRALVPASAAKAVAAVDDSALWQLRQTLLASKHLMWVGATYQSLESHHAYDKAFHDFFDLVDLRPLSLEDMRDALLALARRFGMRGSETPDQAVQAMSQQLATRPERLLALRAITGGNPRTTATLYDLFAAGADGDLHTDLRGLLDLMTPLYKSRMEQLPEQPRKVLAHVMEAWAPIALRDLAQASGIASSTVSSQLVRLEQDGLVQKAPLSGTTRSGYQVTERFFNIWFLMRHASRRVRQRLTWLVEFMPLWYRADELEGIALHRAGVHRQRAGRSVEQAEYSRAVARTLPPGHALRGQLDYQVYRQAREQADATKQRVSDLYPDLFDMEGEDRPYLSAEQCHARFCEVRDQLLNIPAEPGLDGGQWVRRVLGAVEATLDEKRSLAAATTVLTSAKAQQLKIFPSRRFRLKLIRKAFDVQVIDAVSAAMASGRLHPECGDLSFYRAQVIDALGGDIAAAQLALVLFLLTADKADALEAADALQGALPLTAGLLSLLGYGLGRVDAERAQTTYLKAIALDEANAGLWGGLGNLLHVRLKRYDEAEAAYRKAITLDPDNAELWVTLGHLLQDRLQRYDEAEAAYRKAIALDEANAEPWNGLGNLLQYSLKRYEEAEAAYRKAIALDEANAAPWNNLGILLKDHPQRYDEAELAYEAAKRIEPGNPYVWANHGRLLAQLGRHDEACVQFRKALEVLASQAPDSSQDESHLLLQAHLWLENTDLALQALERLAKAASAGTREAFARIREQAFECHELGIGTRLAELMARSEFADFLLPYQLALRAAAAGSEEPMLDAAAEVQAMAKEVLRNLVLAQSATL